MADQLKKYLFEDHSTRVQAVRLEQAWQSGMAHQSYPRCIEQLLGELVSAAALLTASITFDGSLVLQLQGDAAVSLIVVECNSDGSIRATVSLREGHAIPDNGTLQSLLNTNGRGRFMVILDPDRETNEMQPYQGMVPLEGDSVARVLELYMRNSEQLDTRIWLASDTKHTAGLLIQRLPDEGGIKSASGRSEGSTWQRACLLAGTLRHDELLSLPTDTMIHRLFWEEPLIAFEPQDIRWHCPCTRERVGNMLRMLGQTEIEDILQERRHVDVSCNFCGKPYRFDPIDCAQLFTNPGDPPPTEPGTIH